MTKNIAILNSIIFLFAILCMSSCIKTKCYDCEYYYVAGGYYNPITNDTTSITFLSKNYGLDTLNKYYRLGYVRFGTGSTENIHENLCDNELDSLSKIGINYNCKF